MDSGRYVKLLIFLKPSQKSGPPLMLPCQLPGFDNSIASYFFFFFFFFAIPDLHIVVVTKKPPMCQIMSFSLYCINGAIEGRRID